MKARLSVDIAGIGRVAGLVGVVAWMVVAAWPAQASRLSEVRVGTHPGFTRVVFELDGPAGYRLGEPRGEKSPELLLELDAESAARQISSGKSALVRSIQVEPSNRGSTVRIGLSDRDVHVTEMILSRPTRIVLDLRPMGETPAWSGSTTSKTSTPKASPAEKSIAVAPEPVKELAAAAKAPTKTASAPKVPTAVESATGAATAKAADAAKGTAETAKQKADAIATAAAQKAGTAKDAIADRIGTLPDVPPDELEKAAALALGDTPPPPAAEPETLGEGSDSAGAVAEGSDFAEAIDPDGENALDPIDAAEAAAPTLRPDRVPGDASEPIRKPTQTARSSGGGIGGFLTSTTGIVAIAVAFFVALFAFFRMRRRGEEEALSSFMEDEDFSLTGEADEEVEPETEVPAMDVPEIPEPDFAAAAEPQPMMQEPAMEPTPKITDSPVPPPLSAAPSGPIQSDKPDLHEFEQRLSQLESRLDDMMQARERLERQVAAQTEELRVQRAAIARTQRVVRSIARPEEGATEPVPRAPGGN